MYQVLRSRAQRSPFKTPSFFSALLSNSLASDSLCSLKLVHAQLIKLGLRNADTYLGNRCLDLYSKLGTFQDARRAFDDIHHKNVFSWNICLNVFASFGDMNGARQVFDEMPERDVVSWNSMISGYASSGFVDSALGVFSKIQTSGVMPSGYTYSIVLSIVRSVCHGKEIHGNMVRNGVDFSCVVAGNSLVDMYGKLGHVDYAFGVFLSMEELDVVSWNSLIAGCCKSGYEEMAYNQFCVMRSTGCPPDAFTLSSVLTACLNVQHLRKGECVFSLSIKSGFLSNEVVSSAAIHMFSKRNQINTSISIFNETDSWGSVVCNSMISSYARHGLEENAMRVFVLAFGKNVSPTEFTLSCVVNCASVFSPSAQGTQLHCLVTKLGFERDAIVSSSLVEMYEEYGDIDSAMTIFRKMGVKDLVSWNTIIFGLTCNGKITESLRLFRDLLRIGPPPDEITLYGVLLACKYGGLINEGMSIFSSMENKFGVKPGDQHYNCVIDMMVRVGKLNEALKIIKAMPYEPNGSTCASILGACAMQGDLEFIEKVADSWMKSEPKSSLPYMVLGKAYEMRGRWESLVRVKKLMNERKIRKPIGCSWIGIKGRLFPFKENEVLHHGGEDMYSMLRLLTQEMEDESCSYQ